VKGRHGAVVAHDGAVPAYLGPVEAYHGAMKAYPADAYSHPGAVKALSRSLVALLVHCEHVQLKKKVMLYATIALYRHS
jgi:hypothetical protein